MKQVNVVTNKGLRITLQKDLSFSMDGKSARENNLGGRYFDQNNESYYIKIPQSISEFYVEVLASEIINSPLFHLMTARANTPMITYSAVQLYDENKIHHALVSCAQDIKMLCTLINPSSTKRSNWYELKHRKNVYSTIINSGHKDNDHNSGFLAAFFFKVIILMDPSVHSGNVYLSKRDDLHYDEMGFLDFGAAFRSANNGRDHTSPLSDTCDTTVKRLYKDFLGYYKDIPYFFESISKIAQNILHEHPNIHQLLFVHLKNAIDNANSYFDDHPLKYDMYKKLYKTMKLDYTNSTVCAKLLANIITVRIKNTARYTRKSTSFSTSQHFEHTATYSSGNRHANQTVTKRIKTYLQDPALSVRRQFNNDIKSLLYDAVSRSLASTTDKNKQSAAIELLDRIALLEISDFKFIKISKEILKDALRTMMEPKARFIQSGTFGQTKAYLASEHIYKVLQLKLQDPLKDSHLK